MEGHIRKRIRERMREVALTTRQDLVKIKSKALRRRVWFNALSKVERAILDLTIKCVEEIRSNVLAETVSTIVGKILRFFGEGFMTKAERLGNEAVKKLCIVGERWGNNACSTWKCDKCFTRFLGVNALNM